MPQFHTLLISEIFPPTKGGSGRWFWELYSRLSRDEYLIVAGETDNAFQFDKGHNLNVIRFPLSSTNWGIKSISGLKFYIRTFFSLRKLIKNNSIQQIHCGRCLPEGVFGFIINKIYGIPYLCYIHGEDIEAASSSRELTYIVKKVLSNAKTLIANSKNTQQLLTNQWNIKEDKINVLNPGMDANRFIPANYCLDTRKKLNWNDRTVLLTVGRLQKRKGQDMLIQALPEIKKHFPNILYSVIGDGEEKESLIKLTNELNLTKNVQFLSEITDEKMIQCYQQCNLFILPNRADGKDIEGFGMVLCEAQSCGKPVLSGDSGGTKETMIIGETGYIVDCTSPTPLSKKVIDLLSNKDSLNKMGKKARIHSKTTLDWCRHSKKAIDIFNKV